ncbi:secondary thiamine-phosphate synthase enzyme [candidate division TA06 bacterium DG_78]|uniref:Secondary thiamine-phosphate synthase enzyme n=1 Tax=candidate division TA06 bacterium DG_78 TaxID=1703772 RepID=A0A0S7YIC7_UNCT6|nr:MAG: secondary thiamine-phosphate synthase enzyme [candidate division TA06 bacterium DG_78]
MKVINEKIELKTNGCGDLINITPEITQFLQTSMMRKGNLTVFVIGSTAAITSFEYESGLIQDVQNFFEELIPPNKKYHHDETWGDANGFSHLRAALQGPSMTIPFDDAELLLGTWQQIVLAEFDNKPRKRHIIVQIIGE